MEQFIKAYWKTLVFFAVVGIVGGFFVGIYLLDSYPIEIQQQIYDQGLNDVLLGLITAVQSAGYGIALGAAGIWIGKKTGLWKDEKTFEWKPLMISIAVSVLGGLALILPDLLYFGPRSEAIMNSYAAKPSIVYILASVTYGAVIEEVMVRLFAMSLAVFIFRKLFGKKHDKPTVWTLAAANIVSALLFAAGHLPATFLLIGSSPVVIFRCFLLNGGLGLMFGWLYRKYGLRYSMAAHAGCHAVSKLIWILFI